MLGLRQVFIASNSLKLIFRFCFLIVYREHTVNDWEQIVENFTQNLTCV